jgi:hypothetical protein
MRLEDGANGLATHSQHSKAQHSTAQHGTAQHGTVNEGPGEHSRAAGTFIKGAAVWSGPCRWGNVPGFRNFFDSR